MKRDDEARALLAAIDTLKETGGAVEIAGVKIQSCDERGLTADDWDYHDAHLRGGRLVKECPVCGAVDTRAGWHWTPEAPCQSCGATSNTSHEPNCMNYGLYDEQGNAIPAVPLADSGDRTELHGGAVRDRTPGKGRYDLISPIFLRDLALLLEHGAEKYTKRDSDGKVITTGVRNWERGYSLPVCIDSAERHLNQLKAGEDDEDHAIQAAWNLMAFIHIREMVRRGALPESLADYVPLHVRNPVTGRTLPEDDIILGGSLVAGNMRLNSEGFTGVCIFCKTPIALIGGAWVNSENQNSSEGLICSNRLGHLP